MDVEGSNNVALDGGDNIPLGVRCEQNNHLSSIVTRQSVVIADIASPRLTPVSPRQREVVRPAGHLYFSVYLGEQGGGKVCVVFPPCVAEPSGFVSD